MNGSAHLRSQYPRRPACVDCRLCDGFGVWRLKGSDAVRSQSCEDCARTGLDAIPWTELFLVGRVWKWV